MPLELITGKEVSSGEGSLLINILGRNCADKNETVVRKILDVRESFELSRKSIEAKKKRRDNVRKKACTCRRKWWYCGRKSAVRLISIQTIKPGAEPGEVKWVNIHPPPLIFLSPLLSFFPYPSNIEIIFDFSDIITKIHSPFQNPGSAPANAYGASSKVKLFQFPAPVGAETNTSLPDRYASNVFFW